MVICWHLFKDIFGAEFPDYEADQADSFFSPCDAVWYSASKKLYRSLNQMAKLDPRNVYATMEIPSKMEVAPRFALLKCLHC